MSDRFRKVSRLVNLNLSPLELLLFLHQGNVSPLRPLRGQHLENLYPLLLEKEAEGTSEMIVAPLRIVDDLTKKTTKVDRAVQREGGNLLVLQIDLREMQDFLRQVLPAPLKGNLEQGVLAVAQEGVLKGLNERKRAGVADVKKNCSQWMLQRIRRKMLQFQKEKWL
jgi:hypothetical protein